jgi:hypothetical protein
VVEECSVLHPEVGVCGSVLRGGGRLASHSVSCQPLFTRPPMVAPQRLSPQLSRSTIGENTDIVMPTGERSSEDPRFRRAKIRHRAASGWLPTSPGLAASASYCDTQGATQPPSMSAAGLILVLIFDLPVAAYVVSAQTERLINSTNRPARARCYRAQAIERTQAVLCGQHRRKNADQTA